jgi:methylated-DNA-[protein]-cysteine S-methyltransferase
LVQRLQAYFAGEPQGFGDVRVEVDGRSTFQRRVIEACRRVPFGTTISYGQLAARAGSPRAARAVGNCMAANRAPIIIPCHRVVGSGGRLGGFSGPGGLRLKRRLLRLEGVL